MNLMCAPRRRRNLIGMLAAALGALLFAIPASAEQFWVAYEGDDYPENQGWQRHGMYTGGAMRSIRNGSLVLDSLHDDQICDYYEITHSTTPGPGELVIAEWSTLVDARSDHFDAFVIIARDGVPGHVVFGLGRDGLHINFYEALISLEPDTYHTYRFVTWDMVNYELTIDETITYGGVVNPSLLTSGVSFGDGVIGQASLSQWDYLRFGVVPEPRSFVSVFVAAVFISGNWYRRDKRESR